jgi:hypothetical protein
MWAGNYSWLRQYVNLRAEERGDTELEKEEKERKEKEEKREGKEKKEKKEKKGKKHDSRRFHEEADKHRDID